MLFYHGKWFRFHIWRERCLVFLNGDLKWRVLRSSALVDVQNVQGYSHGICQVLVGWQFGCTYFLGDSH